MPFNRYFIFIVIIAFSSCSQSSNTDAVFNRDSLARHIQILSSDSFMGRRPFTEGETRTVSYIQSVFARFGLEPGNGNSYTQDVPLVEITPDSDSTMTVKADTGKIILHNGTDYVVSTERTDSVISLDNDGVVFAGYGVVAPEYNWNDYAGLDVKGKVVLVMVNDPGFGNGDTTMFKGKTMTYYGRWTYKYEEAARQGAKACFIIHNTPGASYPFSVVQTSWGKSNLYLDTRGSDQYRLALKGWVTQDAAFKLLQLGGKDSSLLATADLRGFKGTPLNLKLSTSVKVRSVYNTSKNVIAKITGSKHPDEYIIYTAHWDHLGIGKPDANGDSIYNGAIDNASGSAALLEMARAFKNLDPKPERTIVFLSVTAEEQGLLGSAYYTLHPIFPLDKTVGEINMDGMSAFGKTKDVIITGARQSDLEDYLTEEAKKQGRYIAPESHPEAGHYFRSDHFNFAHVGVPALNAAGGIDMEEGGKEAGRRLEDEYTAKHYHQPSDEFDPKWSLAGCMQDMELLFRVGKRLAFESTWPQWKEGSEFKKLRSH